MDRVIIITIPNSNDSTNPHYISLLDGAQLYQNNLFSQTKFDTSTLHQEVSEYCRGKAKSVTKKIIIRMNTITEDTQLIQKPKLPRAHTKSCVHTSLSLDISIKYLHALIQIYFQIHLTSLKISSHCVFLQISQITLTWEVAHQYSRNLTCKEISASASTGNAFQNSILHFSYGWFFPNGCHFHLGSDFGYESSIHHRRLNRMSFK